MVIKIKEVVSSYSTYEDGEVVFKLIMPRIVKGESVTVDFSGVPSVPSAFVNAAFVRLLEHVSFERVRECLNLKTGEGATLP
jgi:hypothetical protein